jgi:hypothetical protein
MHTYFERIFYTEDYRKEHVFKTFTATELYDIRNGWQSEKMSDEWRSEREKHHIRNDCLGVFSPVKLAKVHYVEMAAIGRMDCSSEDIIFGWQWPSMNGMSNFFLCTIGLMKNEGLLTLYCTVLGFVHLLWWWFASCSRLQRRSARILSVMKKYVWFWLSFWKLS